MIPCHLTFVLLLPTPTINDTCTPRPLPCRLNPHILLLAHRPPLRADDGIPHAQRVMQTQSPVLLRAAPGRGEERLGPLCQRTPCVQTRRHDRGVLLTGQYVRGRNVQRE